MLQHIEEMRNVVIYTRENYYLLIEEASVSSFNLI